MAPPRVTPALLLLLLAWSALLLDRAAAKLDHYRYELSMQNYDQRLIHLASYPVGPGGYFEIALDVTLTIETIHADRGRVMLHLIVCDTEGVDKFQRLPTSGVGSPVSMNVPGYCAMANQTLDDLCLSYPLVDESYDEFVYRSRKPIAAEWRDDGKSYHGDGMLYFYIDACETVGGEEGVLRSCLSRQDSVVLDDACFTCAKNPTYYHPLRTGKSPPTCVVSPAIRPTINIQAQMNICNKNGSCLSADSKFLPTFYLALAIAWAVAWGVWATHIRASREAVVDLQVKMKHVPMALCFYAAMTCAQLYTDRILVGTAQKLVVNLTILSQVFALALPAEVVVLIAKGWKITRAHLDYREHQYIRFITMSWAISYAVLKNSVVKHLTIFLIWGVSWSSVVFMIWYNSAFNLNMLLYQIAMVRQMQLDTTRTPVYTKYMLFRRFRGQLAVFMLTSCIVGILGLVSDTSSDEWRWSTIAADEVLSLLLYVSLGYTFRCRRFSNLIQAPASATADASRTASTNAARPATSTSAAVAPTGPSMPRIEEVPRPKSSMVLVVNPNPNEQSLGTSYVPVNPKATADAKVSPRKDNAMR